jgi:hypothetical protein
MSLRHQLATVIEGMPDGGAVTLPVNWLRQVLETDAESDLPVNSVADMSVIEVAEALNRSPATIRGWCSAGEVPGAYKLKGREWRVPLWGLREFLDGQGNRPGSAVRRRREANLGAWRGEATR